MGFGYLLAMQKSNSTASVGSKKHLCSDCRTWKADIDNFEAPLIPCLVDEVYFAANWNRQQQPRKHQQNVGWSIKNTTMLCYTALYSISIVTIVP
jgi:hypothetical protein